MTLPLLSFIVFAIIGICLRFKMLEVLSNNNFITNFWLWKPIKEFIQFWEIIEKQNNKQIRIQYKVLFWTQIIIVLIYIPIMIFLIKYS